MASLKSKNRTADTAAPARHTSPLVYYGTIVILVITVIAFVVVPSFSGTDSGAGKRLVFGSYAGRPIAYESGSYFARQVQTVNAEKQETVSQEEAGSINYVYDVWLTAFQRTAYRFALVDAAERAGVVVSDDAVNSRLIADPSFQVDGRFSRERFDKVTKFEKNRMIENLREDLLIERYLGDLLALESNPEELAHVKLSATPRRSIEYVAVGLDEYPASERAAWASRNADLFRSVSVSRITVQSSARDAEALRDRIAGGKVAFDEAARESSIDQYATSGGKVGSRTFHEIRSELAAESDAESLFSLARDELSAVLKTNQDSWVIYRVNEPSSPADLSDPDTLDAVGAYMKAWEKGVIEDWAASRAASFAVAAAEDVDAAIAEFGLAFKPAGPFPLNLASGTNDSGFPLIGGIDTYVAPELAGADSDRAFLKAVFSQEPGKLSSAFVLDNHAVVFRVTDLGDAEADSLSILDYYLPYYAGNIEQNAVAEKLLDDERFKNDFDEVFFRVFLGESGS
ncbi:MAG: SurA N-terminal domain-containing protein [Spirochaetales bacterium]|nr:SurA N-terminal domain-containing protein [Spirochaetales bacterium]